jgi:hypothetical protein
MKNVPNRSSKEKSNPMKFFCLAVFNIINQKEHFIQTDLAYPKINKIVL